MSETSERRAARFVFLTDDASVSADARYAWRLDAANHRPLGRAATWTSGLDACRDEAAKFTSGLGEHAGDVVVERHGTRWGWQLAAGGVDAVSTHSYLRRVECLRGFAQFGQMARAADPGDGVVRHFGANTLRGYGSPAPAAGGR